MPQFFVRRMLSTFIIPLCYGAEFSPAVETELGQTWYHGGTTRVASNLGASRSLCFPSHLLTEKGARFVRVFRTIWEMWFHFLQRLTECRGWQGEVPDL